MLSDPYEEINRRKNENNPENKNEANKWLFTKSRILFLISVFVVFSLPLIYRFFSNFI